MIVVGAVLLGLYGLLVNMVPWDFSRLLGVYVAVFAVVSILAGKLFSANRFRFRPGSAWRSSSSAECVFSSAHVPVSASVR